MKTVNVYEGVAINTFHSKMSQYEPHHRVSSKVKYKKHEQTIQQDADKGQSSS